MRILEQDENVKNLLLLDFKQVYYEKKKDFKNI